MGLKMTIFAGKTLIKICPMSYQGKFVFSQLCSLLPKVKFDWLVKKYQGNKYVKTFNCWSHLLVMIFAQLTKRESMRDLIAVLDAHQEKQQHLGFGDKVTLPNLAYANRVRNVRIFEEFAYIMIEIARDKRSSAIKDFCVKNNVYAFDSTTISLCLKTFWWARFRHDKGGIKVHTLYDVKTDIPTFLVISEAAPHDSKVMGMIPYEKYSFYIFDRAYMVTFELFNIDEAGAYFVVREKRRMQYSVVKDLEYSNPDTGVLADQVILFTGTNPKKQYTKPLRRVVYYDKEGKRTFVFYTNNFRITAETVALLYKYRWRVELLFKFLKQHLHIKEFFGTTENAVRIQIYSAIIAYCLVAILERELNLDRDIYDVLRVLELSMFDKSPIVELFKKSNTQTSAEDAIQLSLEFD